MIKERVVEAGRRFAMGDTEQQNEELIEAIHTDFITPDEIAEVFIASVMETLGLDNNMEQRREDRIGKVLVALDTVMVFVYRPDSPPVQSTAADRRKLAEKIADALGGK